jgi:class 3 adenylate cyclase
MRSGITNLISKSRKPITILFTDIVDSTRYWGRKGDIEGRLMVDQHNRLVFPVVHKFKGKIVKTIGDAVMASFTSRENAILAAIGIQQALDEYRKKDDKFTLQLRIGLHTGQALIEKTDIFGDTVNIASRVEEYAEPNEILVSGSTANKLKRKEYNLERKTSFVPKGKSRPMAVYRVDWHEYPSVIYDINFNSVLPIMARQRAELFVYLIAAVGLIYFLFENYLRYVIVDQERAGLLTYSPQQIVTEHPYLVAASVLGVILLLVFLRLLIVMPILLLRLVKGLFGFAIIFFILYYTVPYIPDAFKYNANDVLFQSRHLFVEVLDDDARFYQEHDTGSEMVKQGSSNELYLQVDVTDVNDVMWNKVLVKDGVYGWVERIRPPAVGVTEKRLTISNKFYFRYQDLYILVISLLGFIWGAFSFSVKPV